RRKFRIAGHWSFHLVSKGATRSVRGKFSQARQFYRESWRQVANTVVADWRTAVSMEFPRRISSRPTYTADEAIAPVSRRYDRSSGRISYCTVRGRAAQNAG